MPLTGSMRTDHALAGAGVLAELAALGPSFALDAHPAQSSPAPPWRPLAELFGPSGRLEARVTTVREALAQASGRPAGDVELRVAASIAQLGLAARLICPALGVAALTGRLLEVDPAGMRWQPRASGAVPLSIQESALTPAATERDPAVLADLLAASLLAGPVQALVEASRAFGVSEQVLWGNVASVVHGSVAVIGAGRPDLIGPARAIVAGLLNQPPLQGRHQGGQRDFRRRSCCLVYRLTASAGPVCGDCVLDRAPASRGRNGGDGQAADPVM